RCCASWTTPASLRPATEISDRIGAEGDDDGEGTSDPDLRVPAQARVQAREFTAGARTGPTTAPSRRDREPVGRAGRAVQVGGVPNGRRAGREREALPEGQRAARLADQKRARDRVVVAQEGPRPARQHHWLEA